jgi:hypothetical protein
VHQFCRADFSFKVRNAVKKTAIAIGLLALLAGAAWKTMEPGRTRLVVLLVLGGFALRILLAARSADAGSSDGSSSEQ